MDPLPWKDSAMERQEYMDAGSIKMEGSVKSGIFHTQEWRIKWDKEPAMQVADQRAGKKEREQHPKRKPSEISIKRKAKKH